MKIVKSSNAKIIKNSDTSKLLEYSIDNCLKVCEKMKYKKILLENQ